MSTMRPLLRDAGVGLSHYVEQQATPGHTVCL